jgi:phospholipase/carboxylesterase
MRKIIFLFLIIITICSAASARRMPPADLQYVVHQPAIKSTHPPVLFLLHGYGSNEQDLISLHAQLPQNLLIISLRAPIANGDNSYRWYDINFDNGTKNANALQVAQSTDKIRLMMLKLQKQFLFDDKQIYIGGFSQGAIMSYHLGLATPNTFAGIVVMSGRLLAETKSEIAKHTINKNLKIIILHGTSDDRITLAEALQATQFLTAQKIKFTFKEYNMGHTIIDAEMIDIKAWMQK